MPPPPRQLLERLLERVCLLVERVLGLLEVVCVESAQSEMRFGPPRPAAYRECPRCRHLPQACPRPRRRAPTPSGQGRSGPGASPTAALRRGSGGARRADVLDDGLQLAPPDADGAADVLRPLAGGNGALRSSRVPIAPVTTSTSTRPTAMPTIQVIGPPRMSTSFRGRTGRRPGRRAVARSARRWGRSRARRANAETRSGPEREHVEVAGHLAADDRGLEPGVHGRDDRRRSEDALVHGLRRGEGVRVRSGRHPG